MILRLFSENLTPLLIGGGRERVFPVLQEEKALSWRNPTKWYSPAL
jgi:hypothetical protein